jgi:TRAP-type mannitol/chloroaromatic compound transport system permease large subunit
LSAIFIAYIALTAWLKPELAPPVEAPQVTGWARWGPFVTHAVPLAVIVFAVIGSIVLGWATMLALVFLVPQIATWLPRAL